jgi:hypothetical protein
MYTFLFKTNGSMKNYEEVIYKVPLYTVAVMCLFFLFSALSHVSLPCLGGPQNATSCSDDRRNLRQFEQNQPTNERGA